MSLTNMLLQRMPTGFFHNIKNIIAYIAYFLYKVFNPFLRTNNAPSLLRSILAFNTRYQLFFNYITNFSGAFWSFFNNQFTKACNLRCILLGENNPTFSQI